MLRKLVCVMLCRVIITHKYIGNISCPTEDKKN